MSLKRIEAKVTLEKLLSNAKNLRQLPQYDFRDFMVDSNWDRDDVLLLFEDDIVVTFTDRGKVAKFVKNLEVRTITLFYKGFYYIALPKKNMRNSVFLYK